MNEIKHTRDKRAAFEAWAQSYWFYDSQEECHASDAESAAWDAWEERSALIDDLALALEMIAAEDDAAWKRTKRPLLTSGVRAMLDAALIKAGRKEVPKRSPRFENVSCSGCGRDFGPGDSGYSSCDEHAPTKVRHIRICGDGV
ncbi:hypothetical protein [Burkholderia anthina]|uniref:hypothetical protein n=1 Tax=Burkholderia anthina TaxID=179879 RepID=UPI001AA0555C|nr:hypothetical protein [Burkholderia anthina]QTD88766.1 hypothetical protein J4G50_13145 [Burkholderia anthina]